MWKQWWDRIRTSDCEFGEEDVEPKMTISLGSWVTGGAIHWDRKYMNKLDVKNQFHFHSHWAWGTYEVSG